MNSYDYQNKIVNVKYLSNIVKNTKNLEIKF